MSELNAQETTELIGYTDRLSVAPGEQVRCMISTDLPAYNSALVRLIHGDENTAGPGFKEERVFSAIETERPGRKQFARAGSFVLVPDHTLFSQVTSFTLQAWVLPTTPNQGKAQGLLSKWSEQEGGFCLAISAEGALELWLGDPVESHRFSTDRPMRAHEWYFVAASYDSVSGRLSLVQQAVANWPSDSSSYAIEIDGRPLPACDNGQPILLAATGLQISAISTQAANGLFNGKIDSPCIFDRALAASEIDALRQGTLPAEIGGGGLIAAWDFSLNPSSSFVTDTGQRGRHGKTVNMPTRAVTGHNWTAEESVHSHAPGHYGAIHFHQDDLEDAGWQPDLTLTVPTGLRSGIYAVRLQSGGQFDHVPFVIRPPRGEAQAPILFLVPTFTYLAYANDRMDATQALFADLLDSRPKLDALDRYLAEHPEFAMSLYDSHSDGSGCSYASSLRPLVNMRPNFRHALTNCPRNLGADLYLVDWLEQKEIVYDVAADEDLHHEGLSLLARYKVLVTGTHPEYWSAQMLDALEKYLAQGGRLVYLGGNGFYWVTSLDPERPHIIEVRRGQGGTRAWNSMPGECHHSSTGELGGLWRHRGRPPNQVTGIGFTAQGWGDPAPGYSRRPGSFDPRASFIFEGISEDETIGDFGLVFGGAAGDELDRIDFNQGTPHHALLLASSEGHGPSIRPVIEDFLQIDSSLYATEQEKVRADMVYFETPNNGAVFSVGSICWCASLSHKDYDNNVSRITQNVLTAFSQSAQLPPS